MRTDWIPAVALASLLLTPFAARAVTDTWDGGGSNDLISLNENWLDDTAPLSDIANTDLIFAGVIRPAPVLGAGFSARSVTFNNTAGAFTLSGQTLTLGLDGIVNNDSQTMTFENPVRFSAVDDSTIHAAAGGLTFTNTVALPSVALAVKGAASTSFANISGSGALNKTEAGTMTWAPNVASNLDLTIGGGGVTMAADGTVDFFNASSTIAVDAGIFNINESLTLDGARLTRASTGVVQLAAGKTLTVQNGGDAVITGAFTNNTASTIAVTGAGSTFSTTGNLGIQGGSALNIALGGSVSTGTSRVDIAAFAFNGAVTVDGAGSSLSGGFLNLALNGNTGNLTFTNSSTGTFGGLGVGDGIAGTNGTLSIQSGAIVTGASLFLSTMAAANSGTVTIAGTGSALTLTGAATATIGGASSNTGTLNVVNGGTFNSGTALTTVNATGTITIDGGTYNSNGNLTINGGLLSLGTVGTFSLVAGGILTVHGGGDVMVGGDYLNNTASTILVTGPGSTFSISGLFSVNGGGSAGIATAGKLSYGPGFGLSLVGTSGNGTVTVDGTDSELSGGSLVIGGAGSAGSLTFSNDSRGMLGSLFVGISGTPGTNGTVNIQSGAILEIDGLEIARLPSAGTTGVVTVSGPGSILTVGVTTVVGSPSLTSSTLTVQNGGTVNSTPMLTFVDDTGTVAISGGTFNARGSISLRGGQLTRDAMGVFALSTASTLSVEDGGDAFFTGVYENNTASTIVVTGTGSTFSTTGTLGIQGGSTLNVMAGGSVSTGASNVNIGAFGANGTVTVDGAGSSLSGGFLNLALNGNTGNLTLTNSGTGTFGGVAVSNSNVPGAVGTLSIQSGATVTSTSLFLSSISASNTGTVTITGADSALTLTGAATATIGAANSSTATLNVNSGGIFTTGTNLTFVDATGAINLDSGTLNLRGPLNITGALSIAGTGTIQGSGSITKNRDSTLTFLNSNSYGGGTTLRGGTIIAAAASGALGTGNVTVESGALKLTIQTGVLSAIADSATLTLAGGGLPNLADNGFAELGAGVNEILAGLTLGPNVQTPGTYGSTLSSATFQSDEFFSGPGILTVIPEPGSATALLAGFSRLLGLRRFRRRS